PQIREEIAPIMASADRMISPAEEVRVEQETIDHKDWVHKPHPTTLKVDRQHQTQSYISFLSNSSGQVDLIGLNCQNTENIIAALTTLVEHYPGKRIAIVWDNSAWHQAIALRELLGENNRLGSVHLIWVPLYAPRITTRLKGCAAKRNPRSNRQREAFELTCIAFETFIGSTKFGYRI
ncbi:transposase, partial [Corynebacterium callunae]|uniref:transposase n=1 Tax=Corynebacterium callunae TaxID=1721 RepID=UPI00398235AF